MSYHELFEKHNDEYLHFERIHPSIRRANRPDLHAMMVLDELTFAGLVPEQAVCKGSNYYSEFGLNFDLSQVKLTEEQIIELVRCGVMCSRDNELTIFY